MGWEASNTRRWRLARRPHPRVASRNRASVIAGSAGQCASGDKSSTQDEACGEIQGRRFPAGKNGGHSWPRVLRFGSSQGGFFVRRRIPRRPVTSFGRSNPDP